MTGHKTALGIGVALSLLVVCLASDARSDPGRGRAAHPHRASKIQLYPPVEIDGLPAYDVQESTEALAARPGVVWAMSQNAEEGANEIVFTDIPQTADHIHGIVGAEIPLGHSRIYVQINGDTGSDVYNASAWQFSSSGASGVIPGSGVAVGQIVLGIVASESQYTFTISDYSRSDERKKDLSAHGWAVNGVFAGNMMTIVSGGVRTGSKDAVHSLRFYLAHSELGFSRITKITLYGLSDGP